MATSQAGTITTIDERNLRFLRLPKDAHISNVKRLASYNWIEAATPTIAVPGSPALWLNHGQLRQVSKDSGLFYIDQNTARHPDYPLEPLFRAVDIEKPGFDMSSVDVVSDCNTIHKLLAFVDSRVTGDNFGSSRINVEISDHTAIFYHDVKEFIGPDDAKGRDHEFKKAYTKHEIDGSTGHHRIINYRLGGLNMIIRHETDGYVRSGASNHNQDIANALEDFSLGSSNELSSSSVNGSTIRIKKTGQAVQLASTLEIKTRVDYRPIRISELVAQLWVSQTAQLVRAYHNKKGLFQVPTVEDASAEIKNWENENQQSLRTLVAVIREIIRVVKPHGCATIKYGRGGWRVSGLVISKVEAKDKKKMLPKDVYRRWTKQSDWETAGDGAVDEEGYAVESVAGS